MVDEGQNATISESAVADIEPEIGSDPDATTDHPHTGAPDAGWSAPVATEFARLVVKRSGTETDIEFPIAPPAIIGRFDPAVGPIDVDLGSLPEGSYVSRKHAKITSDAGVWKLEDMGSSNGTFVLRADFERVTECEIVDGTEIALGNARFVFHLQTGSE